MLNVLLYKYRYCKVFDVVTKTIVCCFSDFLISVLSRDFCFPILADFGHRKMRLTV